MAANFRIRLCRNKDSLHLKLTGSFDGSSAYELLNFLKKVCKGIRKVVIHTGSLKQIHPFGRNVFHSNLHTLGVQPIQLELAGVNALHMMPPAGRSQGNARVALSQADSDLQWGD